MKNVRQFMGGLGNRLFQFAFLYSQVREGKLPDIYLQDYTTFDKYKNELRNVFNIVNNVYICQVSLHIRRGDYINNNYYIDLTQTDYYQRAVKMFPNITFRVFCHDGQNVEQDEEDKKWCKNFLDTFIKGKYTIHEPKGETQDLEDMACCEGHIMANSSFSFWASYLDPRNNKVIAPKKWFANDTTISLPNNFEVI